MMIQSIEAIRVAFQAALETLSDTPQLHELEPIRLRFLGKKGEIPGLMRHMAQLPPEEKPGFGKQVNQLRQEAESSLRTLQTQAEERALLASLHQSTVDPTLPGRGIPTGSIHPMNRVRQECIDFFYNLGFQIATGPEIDMDWYNFEALNLPPDHPARDEQDTFYVDDKVVLRTQTSNIQIHVMENQKPPLRVIAPGYVYRVDSDSSHAPMFQQIEGLVVDETITFGDLKGILYLWARSLFTPETELRFRPSYFPFTEPSAELDVACVLCGGKGCRVCKHTGWIEIGGCGSVDPNVFEKVGLDPERYTGFAFGMGIDRIAMLKYSIPEIALLTRSDNRFLRQFS